MALDERGAQDMLIRAAASFTAKGWDGIFYPQGLKAEDRLSFYATKFDTVEFDSFGVELSHSFACQASRGD